MLQHCMLNHFQGVNSFTSYFKAILNKTKLTIGESVEFVRCLLRKGSRYEAIQYM